MADEPIEETFNRVFASIQPIVVGENGDATSKLELRIEAAKIARDLTFFDRTQENDE